MESSTSSSSLTSAPSLCPSQTLILITGASRGIGREIAIQLSAESKGRNNHFILVSRSKELMEEVMLQITEDGNKGTILVGDLSNLGILNDIEMTVEEELVASNFEQVMLINNAGTLANCTKTVTDLRSEQLDEINAYLTVNVSSFMVLTGTFLSLTKGIKSRIVVNISSLLAIKGMKGLSLYAAGKAARDSFIRSVAEEDADTLCINYAPGPVETDMADQMRNQSFLSEFYKEPTNLLSTKQTVSKMISLLKARDFVNGSHVDYFDQ